MEHLNVKFIGQTPNEGATTNPTQTEPAQPTPTPIVETSGMNPLSAIAIVFLLIACVFLYFKSSPIQEAFDGARKNNIEAYNLCERIAAIELDTTAKLDIIKANGADPMQNLRWKCTAVERYAPSTTTGSLNELFDTGSNGF